MIHLSSSQLSLVHQPLDARIFLEGPAGCGKTTIGSYRLLHLMAQGIPANSILLFVPQRTLATPYRKAMESPGVVAGGQVSTLTLGGLARRMVDLFWPFAAEAVGFGHHDRLPQFLTLETAQYYMAHLVRPLFDQGYFDSVSIDRNRLYSQILDNLNKSALVGFPYTEIGERLRTVQIGDASQVRIYADAQYCATLFREYCLAHNLLDFSLQVEVFVRCLWREPTCRDYLLNSYRHLIVDNLEEDTPATHDLLRDWLPYSDSALVIHDQQAGYRRFLGADPEGGYALRELCSQQAVLEESFVTPPAMWTLGRCLAQVLAPQGEELAPQNLPSHETAVHIQSSLAFERENPPRFYPEMLTWVADRVAHLVHVEGIPPNEIVVLAPYLSDALRYSLVERLRARDVPARSHRPSRSLREEPATQCLLTLAELAHPEWGFCPTRFDVAYALVQAINEMDLVRAQLLAEIVYRIKDGRPALTSFDQVKPEIAERITYRMGQRYERLRQWLEGYDQPQEGLDCFLSRLFGEVLSQPGFRFHVNYTAGEVAANLIESIQKFRWSVGETLAEEDCSLGKEYLAMVQDGVIAAQYLRSWNAPTEETVLIAPAYTYLMTNRPVEIQFWLDVGSRGWVDRLYQPLTHPYVLSRGWPSGQIWTYSEEEEVTREALYRLALGLTRRCRGRTYLGLSELNEQGNEDRGPLLRAFQRILQHYPVEAAS
jgi:hypothetical protein